MTSPVTVDATSSGKRRNRSDFVAAEDIVFAVLRGADTGAEESVAQDADDGHHGHHLEDRPALPGVERLRQK